jgi:hypothetical protein
MPADIPKGLEPVENKNVANRYLRYPIKFRNPVSCTVDKCELTFEAQALNFSADQLIVDILPPMRDQLNAEVLSLISQAGTEITLSYSVGEVLLFIKTKLLNRKGSCLAVEVQQPLLKLQRRGALRARVHPPHQAGLAIGGQHYGIYDISVGGLSVVGHTPLLALFPLEQKFSGCRLRFNGLEVPVDLQVSSHTQSRKNVDNWKVGFKFLNLPKGAESVIAKEAYLQTQEMWARLV